MVFAYHHAGGVGLWLFFIFSKHVVAPFFHVATHVIDTELVGLKGCHVIGHGVAELRIFLTVVCHVIEIVAAAVGVALAVVAAACGKLPLSLGGQAEDLAVELGGEQGVEPADEPLAVVPADITLRSIVTRGRAVHYCIPEIIGHLGLADKVVVEGYLVGRLLIFLAVIVAHGERAAIHRHHLKLRAVDSEGNCFGSTVHLIAKSEAQTDSYIGRSSPQAIGGADAIIITTVVAATNHTGISRGRACGICLVLGTIRIRPVKAPLSNIAAHIVDTEFVGLLGGHGTWRVIIRQIIPCHIVSIVAAAIEIALGLVATLGCILPFCLGGQAELLAAKLVGEQGGQTACKLLTFFPADIGNRQIVALVLAGVAAHHGLP